LAYKRKKGASTQDWYLTWSNANAGAKCPGFFVQIFGLIGENNYKNKIFILVLCKRGLL
jgi:hypothetical protein